MSVVPRAVLPALAVFATLTSTSPVPADAQRKPGPPPPPPPPYADVADLAVRAPLVIDGTIHDVVKIKGAEAASVPAGYMRYYLTLDLTALIRGPQAMPPRLGYVYDAPLGAGGKPPKLNKLRVLLFARQVAATPDQIQLVGTDAQIVWSPAADTLTRGIAADVASPKAAPKITGIANAFHAPGTLPGDSETQIFLTTSGHPVSLSITRKQGQPPAWTVALSEVVEDALPPPKRDTFLWYRLACGLPEAIPDQILDGLSGDDTSAIRDDYSVVKKDLGPCRATPAP
jgi:hypothetical protein